jgi:putative oxidoreductase
MKKIFSNYTQDSRTSAALLILRLVFGLALVFHGWSKIQNPTSWAGDSFPGFLQALAALSEFGGGLAWMVGALVPLASFGILCTMAVAIHMHMIIKGDPFVGHEGSYELAMIYFVFAMAMIFVGPGKYSLDQLIFKSKK